MLSGTASRGKGAEGLAGAGDALSAEADLDPHPHFCSKALGYTPAKITSARVSRADILPPSNGEKL